MFGKGLVAVNLASGGGNSKKQEFVYTSGTPAFTLDEKPTGDIVVFLNGLLLSNADYSISEKVVTLNDTLTNGDEITILSPLGTFSFSAQTESSQNVDRGAFNGVFAVDNGKNNFYEDYTSATALVFSIGSNPKKGSKATVRVLGGTDITIPENWNDDGDAISTDSQFYNEFTLLYVSNSDIRLVNRVVDAPDLVAPTFTSTPIATNIQETSFDVTAPINENGTVYGYLLAEGSPKPTDQEIIDNAQSQFVNTGTLSFTGLTNETNYDVHVIAVDTAGNRQADSTLIEVLTANESIPITNGLIYQADFIESGNYTLADTDKLESLSDQSAASNANTVKVSDAERPTYKATGRAGTPCIEFGGSHIIKMPDIMTGEFTKIIFGNYYGQPDNNNARIIWGGDSTNDHSLGFNTLTGDNWTYGNIFTDTKYNLMSPENKKSIFCAMTETRSATEGGLYAGEIEYDRDSQVANTDDSSYIGGRFSGNNDITGEIYGWVLYNRELSTAEISQVLEWGYQRFYTKSHSIKMIAAGQSNLKGSQKTGTPVTPVSGDGYEYNHASGFIRELVEKVGKERELLGNSREPSAIETTIFPKLARQLTVNQSKDLLLMNTARGGSSVGFGTIHWGATGSTDPIRQQAIDGLERFKKHIGTPNILLWDQGLSDQSRLESSTITEAEFKSATEDVFAAFRSVFPNLKIGLILNNPWIDAVDGTTEEFPNGRAKVNSAFNDIATEQANTFIVADASTFTIANGNLEASDGVHWTVQGGDDVAEQIESWIGINL